MRFFAPRLGDLLAVRCLASNNSARFHALRRRAGADRAGAGRPVGLIVSNSANEVRRGKGSEGPKVTRHHRVMSD